jgi:prolyl-tRNA synthetase
VVQGRKSPSERFPGGDETLTLEAMMRDTKALQSSTSHFLGQNFSKAYGVQYLSKEGTQEYAWGTSWGLSTRVVGGVIMTHGDERGLRLPHTIAPIQVVIIPIYRSDDEQSAVLERANSIKSALARNGVRVRLDDRDHYRPGFKFSEWELKGVPLRIEIGPRDVESDQVIVADRVSGDKTTHSTADAVSSVSGLLQASWDALYEDAKAFRDANTHEASTYDQLTKATIRALPLTKEDPGAPCTVCGQPGEERAVWARSY